MQFSGTAITTQLQDQNPCFIMRATPTHFIDLKTEWPHSDKRKLFNSTSRNPISMLSRFKVAADLATRGSHPPRRAMALRFWSRQHHCFRGDAPP
jgi:hypothetical protein